MNSKTITVTYNVFKNITELALSDAQLLQKAQEATALAYAPYSKFYVGAAARLKNGEIIVGSNQENASYPVGTCAERALLAYAANVFNEFAVEAMAISYTSLSGKSEIPISPCGMCRQYLVEYEKRYNHPIRLILGGFEGEVYVLESAGLLLPLSFTAESLNL
jgi:cytidine deaminase